MIRAEPLSSLHDTLYFFPKINRKAKPPHYCHKFPPLNLFLGEGRGAEERGEEGKDGKGRGGERRGKERKIH